MFNVGDEVRLVGIRIFRVSAVSDENITLAYTDLGQEGVDFATVSPENYHALTVVKRA